MRLARFVFGDIDFGIDPVVVARPESFVFTVGIMLDYRIRDVENFFRRTVVSFEFIYFRIFEISFKTENVIYIRASKPESKEV